MRQFTPHSGAAAPKNPAFLLQYGKRLFECEDIFWHSQALLAQEGEQFAKGWFDQAPLAEGVVLGEDSTRWALQH